MPGSSLQAIDRRIHKSLKVRIILVIPLICVLAVGASAADPATCTPVSPTFKVLINNNPAFKGESIHDSPVENKPSIRIETMGITQDGRLRVFVISETEQVIFSTVRQVSVANGSFTLDIPLSEPLKDPSYTRIIFENKSSVVKAEIPTALHKIHGTVTNLKGDPVQAYLLVSWDLDQEVRARAGRDGRYELWLPEEKVGHIFVDDATYGKTSLESFIGHNFILRSDIKLDIQVDRMELYNLRSWATLSTFYVYFVPMSLPRLQNKTTEGTRRAWPELSAGDVTITVNGKETAVQQLEEVKDFTGGSREDWRPGYVASFALKNVLENRRDGQVVVVGVRAIDRVTGATGEAFLINPTID